LILDQVFALSDIPRVGALAFIELILSADNAIVLGVLVAALPAEARKRALYIGLVSAFFLRALALFLASFILQSHWIEAIGGAYLIYLGLHHLLRNKKRKDPNVKATSFWKIVLLVEIFDLVFALDSIIAGVAFIANDMPPNATIHPKLWIVYVGGMLGVIGIRYAADLIGRWIEKFPHLEKSAYLLITLIGVKLFAYLIAPDLPGFEIAFWIIFALLLALGFRRKT